jgi:hypothetical protein
MNILLILRPSNPDRPTRDGITGATRYGDRANNPQGKSRAKRQITMPSQRLSMPGLPAGWLMQRVAQAVMRRKQRAKWEARTLPKLSAPRAAASNLSQRTARLSKPPALPCSFPYHAVELQDAEFGEPRATHMDLPRVSLSGPGQPTQRNTQWRQPTAAHEKMCQSHACRGLASQEVDAISVYAG